jgi:predicted CXXCH cytochrome family protein
LGLLSSFVFFATLTVPSAAQQGIVNTVHNLSITGPGAVRASSEEQVCVFCHTPHNSRVEAPLWNRRDSTAAYIPYNSPSLKASPGQPTGASKLCLSCHDGTIALGDLVNPQATLPMAGSSTMPPGRGLIGTDLRDDHPISFPYADSLGLSGGALKSPATWDPRVRLDAGGELQCTTCHEPHHNDYGAFLALPNQNSALCQQCHNYPFFATTPHADSILQWNGSGPDPWPQTDYIDTRTNACTNCHLSHHAGAPEELLVRPRMDETCFSCHNGNVARFNLEAVFQKPYRHPVESAQGLHQDGESPLDAADHVTCADCHNPHRAQRAPAVAPFVRGSNEGVSGVDLNGSPLGEASYEYQICFKCHGPGSSTPLGTISRQAPSTNLIAAFNPAAPSYHPVAAAGRNADVPSLIAPLSEGSIVYCTDCHDNDGALGGVVGSNGPHGSNYAFLLGRQYRTGDNVGESAANYDLCYSCHSRTSILADQSFPYHLRHIQEEQTPCSVCHDPHGIDFGAGNAVNHAHLINFDLSVVRPHPGNGTLEYRSTGPQAGQCTLLCHGEAHDAETY